MKTNGKKKTLILGLGNPILSDDGIGPWVARELEGRLDRPGVTVIETSMAGLSLLDLLSGYDRAIIVDAIQSSGGKPGQIYRLYPELLGTSCQAACLHRLDLPTALELGRRLGMALPQEIVLYAIEAADLSTFSEECTPEVKRAIPLCAQMILEELSREGDA